MYLTKVLYKRGGCFKEVVDNGCALLNVNNAEQLFETQRNLVEYLVGIGRELENQMFENLGKGYEGAIIKPDGKPIRNL